MNLLKVSSNSKLGEGIASFNLQAITTCPGRTKFCESLCYADKGFFTFPKNKQIYANSKLASEQESFVGEISSELSNNKIKAVRIHAAGDFYSVAYLDKWVEIAKKNPSVKFWAYTRVWRLDEFNNSLLSFSSLPNVQLFASLDEEIVANGEIPPVWLRQADVVDTFIGLQKDYIGCPNQKNSKITCAKCTYCFKPIIGSKTNVAFKKH